MKKLFFLGLLPLLLINTMSSFGPQLTLSFKEQMYTSLSSSGIYVFGVIKNSSKKILFFTVTKTSDAIAKISAFLSTIKRIRRQIKNNGTYLVGNRYVTKEEYEKVMNGRTRGGVSTEEYERMMRQKVEV